MNLEVDSKDELMRSVIFNEMFGIGKEGQQQMRSG